ncbi:UDP-2,3-diacylglucosamine diphosphatase [Dysgonomonas sp. 520]|uniref:UDP-2,3-diacylglucosamine diphosphatase n=1 Tax=Dysgonomonas sp. 520 TaxID=2302931 RepID=UPI0013D5C793|nr:UDP-2,3-diacylglucosamine diphosphatase [Dysgonomonas sp. 520]
MDKKVYFISDVHLGSASHRKNYLKVRDNKDVGEFEAEHEVERKLCRWFDMVKADARAIYLMGDIFDFWFEYKKVVPRGFVRVLGKIAELCDCGIEIHFFVGNHDIWLTDYLSNECGVIVHSQPMVMEILDKKFFLAHGDGLGDKSKSFKMIRYIFHNKFCRFLFAGIHPRWALGLAHVWSNHSRETGDMYGYLGEEKEYLVKFAKEQLKLAPNINFFVFGHRHIILDLMLSQSSRVIILGDWITHFSYGVFDGKTFSMELFENE